MSFDGWDWLFYGGVFGFAWDVGLSGVVCCSFSWFGFSSG